MERLKDDENYDIAKEAYYPLIKIILNDFDVTPANFQKKIKDYSKTNQDLSYLENIFLQLFLNLNPNEQNFKSDINRKLVINLLRYLSSIKQSNLKAKINIGDNQNEESINKIESEISNVPGKVYVINADEILKMLTEIYENDKLYKILFTELDKISKKEVYLAMILLFLPDKQTQKIIQVASHYLKEENKKEIIDFFQDIFRRINLKSEQGFQYFKEVIMLFLDNKSHFIERFPEIEKKYVINNFELRCKRCYTLPFFSINSQKQIIVTYKCGHLKKKESDDLQGIYDAKLKCLCNKLLLCSNIYYICSVCKNIICPVCSSEHFEKCLSIFNVQNNLIDCTCLEHNKKFDAYCESCKVSLCEKCCKEHHHFVEIEKPHTFNSQDLNNFIAKINENKKTEKCVISAIEFIIRENIYKNNIPFIHFMKEILGENAKNKNELFEEFFGEKFKEYYSFMIKQIKLGNYYYLKKLKSMREYYSDNKINEKYQLFLLESFFDCSNYQNKIINNNTMKFSLLSKYYQTVSDIKTQKNIYNAENKIQNSLINNEENNILIKCLSNSESFYQIELLKLIDRSMAENLIIDLIENYPNNFKKMKLNLNIYSDLEKYYKNDKKKFEEITSKNLNDIKNLLPKNANISNNNVESNEIGNKLVFEKPIKYGKDKQLNVEELNKALQLLFFIRHQGTFTAHPSKNTNVVLNSNKHEINIKSDDNINSVFSKIKNLLKNEYAEKYFENSINPKRLFDCLFDCKYKSLINEKSNEEINQKINAILNESLEGIENLNNEELFEDYSQKLENLKEISKSLEDINIFKKVQKSEESDNQLNEFFKRINKILNNEEKCLSLLYRLYNNEYETSTTGDKNIFLSICLNFLLEDISKNIKVKIREFQNIKKEKEIQIEKNEKIIYFLRNVLKNMKKLNEDNKPMIDVQEFKEYLNKNMDISESEEVDINNIRSDLGKIVNKQIDWTKSNKYKLSTLLYLKQSNY